jgi:hypothetical protein
MPRYQTYIAQHIFLVSQDKTESHQLQKTYRRGYSLAVLDDGDIELRLRVLFVA